MTSNVCVLCQEQKVEVGYTCDHGHITCTNCMSAGITECAHHFCDDTKKYFEPDKPIDTEIALLRDENRKLKLAIEREPPAPLVIETPRERHRVVQPQPVQWPQPQPQVWTDSGSADTANYGYTIGVSTAADATTTNYQWSG